MIWEQSENTKLKNIMHHKLSAAIHESEQLLQEMLEKFFAQNPATKVFSYEEHTTENIKRRERLWSESPPEDSRERYWAERNAHPNLDDIGSNLEWHLLMSLMALDPGWRHDGWWCDGVLFFDVKVNIPKPNTLRGLALTYWLTSDETENKSAGLTGYALADIELKLIGTESKVLTYSISLWMDGHWHWFSEKDFSLLPITSPEAPHPDLQVVERILQGTDEDDRFGIVLSEIIDQFLPDVSPPQSETEPAVLAASNRSVSPDCLRLPLPELLWWLESDDKKKARRAGRGIGNIGLPAKEAAPKLLSIVYNKYADVALREECLTALLQIGLNESEAVRLLEFTRADQSAWLIDKIIPILTQAGQQAFPAIWMLLKDEPTEEWVDPMISITIFRYLQQQGEVALPLLLQLMALPLWSDDVLRVLHACGPKAIPPLLGWLDHHMEEFRAIAASALGQIGVPDSAVIDALRQTLDDPDMLVCVRSAEALGKLGVAALPVLSEALETGDKIVLCWVIQSLGKLGALAHPIANRLRLLRDGDDLAVSYFASQALSHIEN